MRLLVCLIASVHLWLALFLTARPSLAEHSPQPQDTLKQMLRITWKKGPDLPQGLQDNGAGIISKALISVGGFCSGQKDVPGKPDKYPRGFLKKVWGLDLSLPPQPAACVEIQDKLGAPIPGYTLEDLAEMIGDEIQRVASWKKT